MIMPAAPIPASPQSKPSDEVSTVWTGGTLVLSIGEPATPLPALWVVPGGSTRSSGRALAAGAEIAAATSSAAVVFFMT